MEKYKELFEQAKYVLDEDTKRFTRIDTKASIYLSVLTLFFGILLFAYQWSIENFIQLDSWIDYTGIVILILLLIIIALAWYFSFKVLKTHELKRMPINDEMIEFFNNNTLINIYYALSKEIKNAYLYNRQISDKKGEFIAKSYKFTILSFFVVIVLLILISVKAYLNTRMAL